MRLLGETVRAFKSGMRGEDYHLPPDAELDRAGEAKPQDAPDKYEQLARLNDLRLAGGLSDEEYQREKAKLLDEP
jgi:Sec-independent protein translocase protein TatA